jgi:hypothetical protein
MQLDRRFSGTPKTKEVSGSKSNELKENRTFDPKCSVGSGITIIIIELKSSFIEPKSFRTPCGPLNEVKRCDRRDHSDRRCEINNQKQYRDWDESGSSRGIGRSNNGIMRSGNGERRRFQSGFCPPEIECYRWYERLNWQFSLLDSEFLS